MRRFRFAFLALACFLGFLFGALAFCLRRVFLLTAHGRFFAFGELPAFGGFFSRGFRRFARRGFRRVDRFPA